MFGSHLMNVSKTLYKTLIKLLNSLGFIIHPGKSIFLPKKEIIFLGFYINFKKMEITPADTKNQKKKNL